MEIDPQQLGLEAGGGAMIGAVIGYAAKKIAKLLAVIVGLQLALFRFLESKGILQVDWSRLTNGMVQTQEKVNDPGWIEPIVSSLSIGAGFAGGFLVGFKRG